jgi:bifunctional non-homologous end joining protein LigD
VFIVRFGRARLFTRRGYDWSDRYPLIRLAAEALTVDATIDGESVICDGDGLADFERLHSREHDRSAVLFAFDPLELEGRDLRTDPLERRKDQLWALLVAPTTEIIFNEHLEEVPSVLAPRRPNKTSLAL